MSISTLRSELEEQARAFAWEQWSEIGIPADGEGLDSRAADPEALLLFSLELGRGEARLFDEVLDWLATNERLVSVQRLRNLARDPADRALVEGALGWVAQTRPRARLSSKPRSGPSEPEPLFRRGAAPIKEPDPAFLAQGLLRSRRTPRGLALPPDPVRAINFAFRLRHLLGVSARAEVVRVLLGTEEARMSVQAIAASAGYAKRNVHDALGGLRAAGAVELVSQASDQRYRAPKDRWGALFDVEPEQLPQHREWVALLYALRRIVRWLGDHRTSELSDYLLASEARVLIEDIAPDLQRAGVRVIDRAPTGAEYWRQAVETFRAAAAALGQ